ncbi:hypothetical protein [Limnospira indica]|uniref:Uncharacterized protein n=1 Tax=Limnospira indica PCC 8005 TaxID=376219 RepID=A0A9P1KC58_9CYAN|nr:hypothetical protein [Limnospira indica]CDM93140.1 hypothetical protein (membrane) [Limnospira indica PCC 8005]
MLTPNSYPLNRRHFLGSIALVTLGLLTKDLINPLSVQADSQGLGKGNISLETYHIFVPYTIARNGGKQIVTLRSGNDLSVKIPAQIEDNQEMTIKGGGFEGKDITLVLHTLYDKKTRIDDKIYQEIGQNIKFIRPGSSRSKCKSVYEQIEDGEYVKDLSALNLLDYAIASSKLDSTIQARYQLASTNSRLVGLQQAIDSTLNESTLSPEEQKIIKGTFAYVRANEPCPDFNALTALDAIVVGSDLPPEIQVTYSLASAKSRALTVDLILVNEIWQSPQLSSETKENYLSIYQEVRDGNKLEDTRTLKALDSFIAQANIPDNAKMVYQAARQQDLENIVSQNNYDVLSLVKPAKNAAKIGSAIVPVSVNALSASGVSAGTGTLISTLSGGAATNAALAALGGGSVAAGGLGMLGGLAVATGGAALIGAAGVVSIALVSKMDGEDKKNLGIAIGTGTIAGATTILGAWTAATALGVAGSLSGAAATTAIMAALGGVSVMTGGAAAVAFGTAFWVWSSMKKGKKRDQSVLEQLETLSYIYTEEEIPSRIGEFVQNQVQSQYKFTNGFSAPNIPLDRLSKALEKWLYLKDNEKVIALIDTSGFMSTQGIAFTDDRILWNHHYVKYQDLEKSWGDLLEMLPQESDRRILTKFLREISKQYASV